MRRSYCSLAVLCILVSLAASGCTSRTLPLPPPEVTEIALEASGMARIEGLAQEGASVGVINDFTLEGVIVTTGQSGCNRSCQFSATVKADAGDPLRVYQFFETPAGIEVSVPSR